MSVYEDEDGIDGPFDRAMRSAMREDAMNKTDRRRASIEKLNDPSTADNMDVRKAIVARMQAGEITLAEAQSELASIKRAGKKAGRPVWG